MQSRRWQGQAPRNTLLHPVWEPVINGAPPDEPFVARCLLGAGWVGANCRLSMLDLRVWAALCGMLREQLPDVDAGAPELRDMAVRTVETTGYQLSDRVFGQDGGNRYRRLLRSLARLRAAEVTVQVVESDPELAAERVVTGYVRLTGEVWLATTRLDLRTPREWGALKGTSSLRIEIGHWVAQQVVAGRCTWLDLDLLRALGPGMPARLWVALEAWGRWPARTFDGQEEAAIGLGSRRFNHLVSASTTAYVMHDGHLIAPANAWSLSIPPTSWCAANDELGLRWWLGESAALRVALRHAAERRGARPGSRASMSARSGRLSGLRPGIR